MKKMIYLIRGCPGSGKSSVSEDTADGKYPVFAADDYFMVDGEYKFDPTKLYAAHMTCQRRTEEEMILGTKKIFVNNTFTKAKELKPYKALAEKHGYIVYILTVENHHGGKDIHDVPEETLVKMETNLRGSIKLR